MKYLIFLSLTFFCGFQLMAKNAIELTVIEVESVFADGRTKHPVVPAAQIKSSEVIDTTLFLNVAQNSNCKYTIQIDTSFMEMIPVSVRGRVLAEKDEDSTGSTGALVRLSIDLKPLIDHHKGIYGVTKSADGTLVTYKFKLQLGSESLDQMIEYKF